MSVVTAWSVFFHDRVRMRGRVFHLAGRVRQVEPEDGEVVQAIVQGRRPYTVSIRAEKGAAVAECNCSAFARGAYCPHIWAILLDLQQRAGHQGSSDQVLSGLKVRSPKARRRDETAGDNRPAEAPWTGRLDQLRPAASELQREVADGLTEPRQIGYVLLPQLSSRCGGPVLELRYRTPITAGWSKLKPLRISLATVAEFGDPIDRELCALVIGAAPVDETAFQVGRAHSTFCLPAGARRTMLKRMISTGRCFLDVDEDAGAGGNEEVLLRWDGDEPWVLWVVGVEAEDELLVTAELRRGDQRISVSDPDLLTGGSDGLVTWAGRAAPFDDCGAMRWVGQFRDALGAEGRRKPIRVPRGEIDRFLDQLYMLPQLPEIDLPPGIGRTEKNLKPVPHLDLIDPASIGAPSSLASLKNQIVAKLWLAYGEHRVGVGQPGRFVAVGSAQSAEEDQVEESYPDAQRLIRRDRRSERQALTTLTTLGLRPLSGVDDADWTGQLRVKQMPFVVRQLLAKGWVVTAERALIRSPGPATLSISSGIDWFELRGSFAYERSDGCREEVPVPQIVAAAREGRNLISLGDGSKGLLPEKWLREHGLLAALGEPQSDHVRYSPSQVAMLDAMISDHELVSEDPRFSHARQRLHEFEGIRPLAESVAFHGDLRPYQREGLGWLAFLRWLGAGGILADDMGLGKTVQVLALLQARYGGEPDHTDDSALFKPAKAVVAEDSEASVGEGVDADLGHCPSLVVAPRSVVFNWLDEAERFTPDLRSVAYAGADRDIIRSSFHDLDMVVMSYGLLRRDIDELRHHQFDYVVLDEAQVIKNPASQSAKAARLLRARHRLALTGTPIENHLGDLWSIFEFLNRGMLGSSARFAELLRGVSSARPGLGGQEPVAGADSSRHGALTQIAAGLRPFILRRTKKQVLADLPEKTEQTIVCEMDSSQRQIYEELRQYYREHLFDQLDVTATADRRRRALSGQSTFIVLEALLRLRQAACHPGLLDDRWADQPSAKMEALLGMLPNLIEEGAKALVFSQFTSMLALVRRQFDQRSIRYAYLDGQTRDRKQVVEQFQTDPKISVFLISLKAGGFGLNLTAAEYVFILDPWWNPAVEAQAIDRAHRIGQRRRVFAYRMVCQDTVEQRIIELQERKRQIADAIIGGDQNLLRDLTRGELEQLLI